VRLYLSGSGVVIITRFQVDTFSLLTPDQISGKTFFIKNPNRGVKSGLRSEVFTFLAQARQYDAEVKLVDGMRLTLGNTAVHFSRPVPGVSGKEGEVLPLAIQERERTFLYTSEIAGQVNNTLAGFISHVSPEVVYLDGPQWPPEDDKKETERFFTRMERISDALSGSPVRTLIIDHHIVRDPRWEQQHERIFSRLRSGRMSVVTAATYRGDENNPLEARRQLLYEAEPPHEKLL